MGPPATPPNWWRRNCGFTVPAGAKKLRAFIDSCRANSKTLPRSALAPDLVVRLTTPPLNRPNSAGGLLLSILNSWIASMLGKNATCPGSGCSTEMPSNRYSLVRGRPPLMRGNGAAGGGGTATPGARAARLRKLRPLSGRSTIAAVVDHVPEARRLAAQEWRVGADGHGLVDRAHLRAVRPPERSRPWQGRCPRASTAGIRSAPRAAGSTPGASPATT